MAVYRFKISLEDNEDIFRDVEIKASQNFEDFHAAIQEAFKFDAKHAASFFVSDDYWRKNQEITLRKEDLPLDADEVKKNIAPKKLMKDCRIASFIEQPHQRFVYVFDPDTQWTFLIEMLKIGEENKRQNYPLVVRSAGTPPKQYKQVVAAKEELSADMAMAALLGDIESENDDEAYNDSETETEEELVEEDDINSLEGEERAEGEGEEEAEEGLGTGEEEQ